MKKLLIAFLLVILAHSSAFASLTLEDIKAPEENFYRLGTTDTPEIKVDFDTEKTNPGRAKKIAQLSLEGQVVQEFESVSDAARKTGISLKHIQNELSKEMSSEWKIL